MVYIETYERAKRFPIRAPLLLREQGEPEWRQGSTLNLSCSGVLFRIDGQPPGVGRAVDFILTLPLNGLTPAPAVRCSGRVVRIATEELAAGGRLVAMTIDSHAFEVRPPA